MAEETVHGGRLVARALRAAGVSTLFTLSGGHLFSVYDGCREEGIALIDTRHEQTAAFAAEGWSKLTRRLGACALTAGPGVTNGMSAVASAAENHSPMLVLGGRAPEFRWGQGSLQELDHVPFMAPLTRMAATARATAEIPGLIGEAVAAAYGPHGGPAFIDLPLDVVFGEAAGGPRGGRLPKPWEGEAAPAEAISAAAAALAGAQRPVIMAGTDLYWGHGEDALRELAESQEIPVFLNGLGRGCLPADHRLALARSRSQALAEADVALVIGVPLDFRLGFGAAFAPDATVIGIDVAPGDKHSPRAFDHTHVDRRAAGDPQRAGRRRGSRRGGARRGPGGMGELAAHDRAHAPRGRTAGDGRRAGAAAPDADLRRARRDARPRRDRDR
jgi:acetolactate synthase-1/2/3 large subunit